MAPRFRAHGEFSTRVEGRLVISEVTGPWNIELVRECTAELHAMALPLAASGPHVGVAVIHGSILCPPDAFALLAGSIRYAARRLGCIGNCIVAGPQVEGRDLMQAQYAQIYVGLTPYGRFDDLDSARAWAFDLLAKAPPGAPFTGVKNSL